MIEVFLVLPKKFFIFAIRTLILFPILTGNHRDYNQFDGKDLRVSQSIFMIVEKQRMWLLISLSKYRHFNLRKF
jgi:hypothetical protein